MDNASRIKQGAALAVTSLRMGWTWLARALREGRHSLRGRMLYTLIGLLTALVLLQAEEHHSRVDSRRALQEAGRKEAALGMAAAFGESLDHLYQVERVIAAAALSGRLSQDQVNAYLREVREQYPGMASLQIIAPNGVVRFASPDQGGAGDIANQPFFLALRPPSTQTHNLSGVYPGGPEGGERVRVSSVVTGIGGQMLGIVSMEFYTTALAELLLHGNKELVELVVDGNGQLVASTRGPGVQDVAERDPRVLRAVWERRPYPVTLRLSETELVMGYAAPVSGTDWTVVYLRPEESVAAVDQETQISLLVMVAVVLALGGAMWIVLGASLRPLDRLTAAALRLGSDARRVDGSNLSLPELSTDVREFERLADAFNRMARDLEATHRELTDAKRRLELANRDLQARVRARELELEAEHQKVLRAERLSTLGLFSSAIAHDLRNPLNTVSLGVYWLKSRFAEVHDDRVTSRLETITRELGRAEQIIRTLLAFARTGELDRQPLNVNTLVEEVLEVVHPPDEVRLSLALAPELPPVPADRAQLFQVLENLIRNAFQAMPEGGEVRVSSLVNCETCCLLVSDTGPGIPEDLHAAIFEPLVTTKSTGTGLGLALSKRIIDAHGGAIWVESRPGHGATFHVELPLLLAAVPGSPSEAGGSAARS
jgi:signal transduction histidine kinase